VDAALLAAAPGLRIIAGALKGPDNIDIPACTRAGVWVSVVPDLLTEPTAELALGLALSLQRHIGAGDARVRALHGGWRPVLYGHGIAGSTVGIAGQGRLGRAIARLVAAFRPARLLAHDPAGVAPEAEPAEWPALLAAADLLFLALPLTPETQHRLDASALALLPPGARVVNVGRGSVAEEAAVAAALGTGRLGGYAADVFAFEDLSRADRPAAVPPALLAAPNTLFTPHLGSATRAARRAIEGAAARNVIAALRGQVPPDAVNRPRVQPAAAG
jgi:phosphonate dehydrogenase